MPSDLDDLIAEAAERDGHYAIAHALLRVASALRQLGLNDAATRMGAIEVLAGEVGRAGGALSAIAESLEDRFGVPADRTR